MVKDVQKKENGKIVTWVKTKIDDLRTWYYSEDNVLRIVRFPGTKLPLLDVVMTFFKNFTKGRTLDRAAGVAFNFFLALFPLILFFFTLIPYIPIPNLYERVLMLLQTSFLPSGTLDFVTDTIDGIMNQPHDGLLSVSIVLCLVFGSSGVVAFFNGFRNVYADYLKEKKLTLKNWLQQRLFAILMLLILGALIVISIVLISVGGTALKFLVTEKILKGGFVLFLFNLLRWLITILALCFTVATLYYFGNVKFNEHYRKELKRPGKNGKMYRDFVVFSPGSILTTALFILATVGFNIYISNFSRYNALYGSIGTLIILLMWIWILAIVILAGNDLNSSIRREADRISAEENDERERQIVIEDMKQRIQYYAKENEERDKRIAKLQNEIKEKQELVRKLTEEKKDCDLIIKAYSAFIEQELKGTSPHDDDDDPFENSTQNP